MRNGNELFMISWEKRPLCIHSYAIISNTLCENKKCLGQADGCGCITGCDETSNYFNKFISMLKFCINLAHGVSQSRE